MQVYEMLVIQQDFIETLQDIRQSVLDLTDGAPDKVKTTDVLGIIDKRIKEIEDESRRILGQ